MESEFQRGPALVVCGDCAHFTPDDINPAQGMGLCAIDYWWHTHSTSEHASWRKTPPWPWAARYCRKFKAARPQAAAA